MDSWFTISLILCAFGLLKELTLSEPFITEYIIEYKNVTAEEIIHIAFPVSTYASLGSLVIVLLVTDLLRYKPVVVFEGVCLALTWSILTLFSGLTSVIIAEVFYGVAAAAEVGYSVYIYAQVDKKYYKRVTSYTYSARLAGKFICGLVAQILITFEFMNYHQLNYITVSCIIIGVIFTLFLPNVGVNQQYYLKSSKPLSSPDVEDVAPLKRNNDDVERRISSESSRSEGSCFFTLRKSLEALRLDFQTAYGNSYVLKWSLWWAIASAGQYQVINYVQALWEKIREESGNEDALYNGAVKAVHTFLSALLSFGIGHMTLSWEKWGEVTLTLISVVQGFMLIWMAETNSLNLAYLSYIIFRTIHPVMITVASAEVAQRIRKDSYGLIFGLNTFIALALQTILTLVVSDMKGLALGERSQYVVYGVCFIILGVLIGGTSIISCCSNSKSNREGKEHRKEEGNGSRNESVKTKDDAVDNLNVKISSLEC